MIARLGTTADAVLAKELGVSYQTVWLQRRKLGIPGSNRISWTPEMIARLGSASDGALAHEWGVSLLSVWKKRHELSIPAYSGSNPLGRVISPALKAKLDELRPILLQRYRDAGLPLRKLDDLQVIEVAVNELLATAKRARTRQLYAVGGEKAGGGTADGGA